MRRPIRAPERPHLVALGRVLAMTRRGAGLTQRELALYADLSRVQVARIETGTTRTRRSTLARMAAALVVHNPGLGSVERLVEDLVATVGPALAEESVYAERVARRRTARAQAKWRADEKDAELRCLHGIFDRERSEWWHWRPEAEKAEARAETWGYFDAHRTQMRRDHDEVREVARRARL